MSKKSFKQVKIIDYRYNDLVLSKFVNTMMVDGKKSVALHVMYEALDWLSKKVEGEDIINVFHKALDNAKPDIEVRSRRVGGSTYQVPIEISQHRQRALVMRWIIKGARNRAGKSMGSKLGAELLDAYNSTGSAYKKMEETHRMAEANKAFAHYRW